MGEHYGVLGGEGERGTVQTNSTTARWIDMERNRQLMANYGRRGEGDCTDKQHHSKVDRHGMK